MIAAALRIAALLLAGAAATTTAPAQQTLYPARTVRLILPFPPGGSTDLLGRAVAEKLGERLGTQVVAENRPGAGGNVGAEAAARASPDGHTLVLCAPSLAISPSLYRKLNYDPLRELTPIALVATIPNLVVVHPSVPAQSLADLTQLAKKHPGKLNFGSGGAGTSGHLASEMFRALTRTDLVHVPYKGAETAMVALLAGQIQMLVIGTPAAVPNVKNGKLRALAVLTKERYAGLPDVPTAAEAGLPGFEVDTWYGILAPSGVPRDIIARINGELTQMMQTQGMRERLAAMGIQPLTSTPEEFGEFIRSEAEKWAKVVKESGARVD